MTVAAHYPEIRQEVARILLYRANAHGLETKTPWLRSYLRLILRTLQATEIRRKQKMKKIRVDW